MSKRRRNLKETTRKKLSILFPVIVAVLIVYWFLWGSIGAPRESDYMHEVIDNAMGFYIDSPINKYYIDVIPYEDLSYRYRKVISEETYKNADTPEEIHSIYQRIMEQNKKLKINEKKHLSTDGYRQGTAYEVLLVNGTNYVYCHDIVIALNPITFQPYIYKWRINEE